MFHFTKRRWRSTHTSRNTDGHLRWRLAIYGMRHEVAVQPAEPSFAFGQTAAASRFEREESVFASCWESHLLPLHDFAEGTVANESFAVKDIAPKWSHARCHT